MKEIHLRRHAEKSSGGILTDNGIKTAMELSQHLPEFAKVVSSDSSRTQLTANLLTGVEAIVDARAGFYMASSEKSEAINQLAAEHGLTFLEAVNRYQDAEVLDGIDNKADELNQLIGELSTNFKKMRRRLLFRMI